MVRPVPTTDLDALKFDALERFMDVLEPSPAPELEEAQYGFLERCDGVLHGTIRPFLSPERLAHVADEPLRESLVSRVDRFEADPEESVGAVLEECLQLLEALEDVATAWMSVVVLDAESIVRLYNTLLAWEAGDQELSHLQEAIRPLLDRSLLLKGESKSRFLVRFEHGASSEVFSLLRRFLQAHLEYGEALQVRFLERYPELLTEIEGNLMNEVRRAA